LDEKPKSQVPLLTNALAMSYAYALYPTWMRHQWLLDRLKDQQDLAVQRAFDECCDFYEQLMHPEMLCCIMLGVLGCNGVLGCSESSDIVGSRLR